MSAYISFHGSGRIEARIENAGEVTERLCLTIGGTDLTIFPGPLGEDLPLLRGYVIAINAVNRHHDRSNVVPLRREPNDAA